MRLILIGFLIIILFICLIGIIGLILPTKRKVTKIYEFNSSLAQVWNKIRNVSEQTSWRSDLKEVKIKSENPLIWGETFQNNFTTIFQSLKEEPEKEWQIKALEPNYIDGIWRGILKKIKMEEQMYPLLNQYKSRILISGFYHLSSLIRIK